MELGHHVCWERRAEGSARQLLGFISHGDAGRPEGRKSQVRVTAMGLAADGDLSATESRRDLLDGRELVLDCREGRRSLSGWQVLQQLCAPSSHVTTSRDVTDHAADDMTIEQEVVATGCEAVKRVRDRGPEGVNAGPLAHA